jgi:hypothetical protein
MAAAHAETDQQFGEGYNEKTDADRARFIQEACSRRDVDEAGDRLHAVFEEMTPLARAIVALPATSMEALRAKALVSLWEVAPLTADSNEFYFDHETQFQLLFSAVAEFCGLGAKIAAIGYTLPELPDIYSDDEGEEA